MARTCPFKQSIKVFAGLTTKAQVSKKSFTAHSWCVSERCSSLRVKNRSRLPVFVILATEKLKKDLQLDLKSPKLILVINYGTYEV